MAEASIDYSYRYPFASNLADGDGAGHLQLATSQSADTYPYFFEGRLLQPRTTAQLLFALSKVVATRYYIPPNMLKKILAERDPVVTSGGGLLRFEGFSACCGAYARVDITPDGYKGDIVGKGTTNVDFNTSMRSALAGIIDSDRLSVSVGPDEVMLKRGFERIVERKVKLPLRWIKGFVEVQAYQSVMEKRHSVSKQELTRFLQTLPRNANNKSTFWVSPAGKGLRLSQIASKEGIKVAGMDRLKLIRDLAPFADELTIYAHPKGESSEWMLRCGGVCFSLTITADVSRGFSGEGQVLANLSAAGSDDIAKVRSSLNWESMVNLQDIAQKWQLDESSVKQSLSVLGSRGLVGYDLNTNAFFHRELPFDADLVESIHPRIQGARKLFNAGNVKILKTSADAIEAEVKGTDVNHRVRIGNDDDGVCTCQWHSKYQGSRGPCKHILALQLATGHDDLE